MDMQFFLDVSEILQKNSRSYTLNLTEEIDFENRPFSKKENIVIHKVSDRHERNFEVFVFIIGGICVLKINTLADKLQKLEISPVAPLKLIVAAYDNSLYRFI